MLEYNERLRARVSWWLMTAGCVLIFGAELFAGFSRTVGVFVYLVMGPICAALLL